MISYIVFDKLSANFKNEIKLKNKTLNSNVFSTKIKNQVAPIRCKNDEKDILLKILKNFLNTLNLLKVQPSLLSFYQIRYNHRTQSLNEYHQYQLF